MNDISYVKLKDLVGENIKIEKIFPAKYKLWDSVEGKMLISETWLKDYKKVYTVDTDKGRLDMSPSQVSQMLEGVVEDGRADINGRKFNIKSNNKTGMEIRYFINPVKEDEVFEEELPAGW